MRFSFVKQVLVEMKKNKKIVFLTGDLGFNALEPIQKVFPGRFVNVGIAEANMIGLAAGLALTGKKVIVYSIAPFVTLRVAEQVRNDICYHNLDVKIVGVGGGFNYASHGLTHHTIEDFAVMGSMPNMMILNPAYSEEAAALAKAAILRQGPVYFRLGKNPEMKISGGGNKIALGKSVSNHLTMTPKPSSVVLYKMTP
jgi:transketolase